MFSKDLWGERFMKVLFVCTQGLSSAIAVNELKREASKEHLNMEVLAVGIREFEEEIENGWNLVMVAPQIRHKYNYLNSISREKNIPCVLIESQAYIPMGGKMLLSQVKAKLQRVNN